MISYAQMREDIILHRALSHVPAEAGFYIDIGGYHPIRDSVTKHFYEHGWRGINVEPGQRFFGDFVTDRPRDINLQVAVSDHAGEAVFFEMDQVSTLEQRFADRHRDHQTAEYRVQVVTLADICREWVKGEIHFLKIDVEGHEAAVIRGMDFTRFRPWILVIEATEPNNLAATTHHEWEHMIVAADYAFMCTDVLNRYYVAKERPELFQRCGVPGDDFTYARDFYKISDLEAELASAQQRIGELEQALAAQAARAKRRRWPFFG
jgi:FkbM family methyltransferase